MKMKKLLTLLLCLIPICSEATKSNITLADTAVVAAGKVLQVTGRIQADSIFSGNKVVTPIFSSAWTAGKRVRGNLFDLDTLRLRDSLTVLPGAKVKVMSGATLEFPRINPDSIGAPVVSWPYDFTAGKRVRLNLADADSLRIRDSLTVTAGAKSKFLPGSIFQVANIQPDTLGSSWLMVPGKRITAPYADLDTLAGGTIATRLSLDTLRLVDSLTVAAGAKSKFLPGSIFQVANIQPDTLGSSWLMVPGKRITAPYADLDTLAGGTVSTGILNIGTATNWNLGGTAFTGTMAKVNAVTDGSVLTTQHYHSALSASDGSPNPALSVDANGAVLMIIDTLTIQSGAFGNGSSGAKTIAAADSLINATTIATSGAITLTSANNLWRANSTATISHALTVPQQNGQARGSYPTTYGSPGIPLGAVLATLNTKAIPRPIRPGGGSTALCGGILQIIASGNVAINAAINDTGKTTTSDGGGGGGLVVIVSAGTISGSAAINVQGTGGHATAAARGGAGSYSGEPGGHAGFGGSGGGAPWSGTEGSGGAGYVAGKAGAGGAAGGGGGGSIDNAGTAAGGDYNGGVGGAGDGILSWYAPKESIFTYSGAVRATVATSSTGGNGSHTGAAGGSNGGGGGGGGFGDGATTGGNGGAAAALGGSGGGGGGGSASGTYGNGGNGGTGAPSLYALSSRSPYAGLPGGMGGGGGGGTYTSGTIGNGGAGATAISAFVASMGAGQGGDGGTGSNGTTSKTGGNGGAGGNGGGAAGLVLLIAPTVTYSGTVTGRLVIIDGDRAHQMLRGVFQN